MAYDMRKQEDVDEYLKNLKTEYSFGCYREKNPEVCHLLGDYLEIIERNFKEARKIFKMNCEDYNFARSCYKIGYYTYLGKGFEEVDHVKALSYFEKGCSLDDPSSCFNAGVVLLTPDSSGQIPKDNLEKGLSRWEKSCRLKHGKACHFLGLAYMKGSKTGLPKDLKKSVEFCKKSCLLGNQHSCYNAGEIYLNGGDGVEKNTELAEKWKRKGKEIDDQLAMGMPLTFQEGLPPV